MVECIGMRDLCENSEKRDEIGLDTIVKIRINW